MTKLQPAFVVTLFVGAGLTFFYFQYTF